MWLKGGPHEVVGTRAAANESQAKLAFAKPVVYKLDHRVYIRSGCPWCSHSAATSDATALSMFVAATDLALGLTAAVVAQASYAAGATWAHAHEGRHQTWQPSIYAQANEPKIGSTAEV